MRRWRRSSTGAQEALGPIDLVFNNAGVYLGGPMRATARFDDWRFVLDVNLDGVFRVGQKASRRRCASGALGGYVVNTASIGGFMAHDAGLAYGPSASSACVAYSDALRMNLASARNRRVDALPWTDRDQLAGLGPPARNAKERTGGACRKPSHR